MDTGQTAQNAGFIGRHALWSEQQQTAAREILRVVDEQQLRTVRVATADLQGRLRCKTLMAKAFKSVLKQGMEFHCAQFSFDSAEAIAYNPFTADASLGVAEMAGFSGIVLVPDPNTFRVLPWCDRTGWILGDMHFRDGRPVPFDARHKLKAAEAALADAGYHFVGGLEVEFYVARVLDAKLGAEHAGTLGQPPTPPTVEPLGRGFTVLAEQDLDAMEAIQNRLADHCVALDLPLRTMEHEMGPGQLEFTFEVQSGLDTADCMVLFRSMVKQVCAREGLHATFMTQPGLPNFFASGWHLHQSMTDADGHNAFATPAGSDELLSAAGRQYVGGLIEHAVEGSVFTTPTVNGYRRRKPNSLAPDRSTWGHDNRAAMISVHGAPGDPATHVENRIGDPAANPYLYIASQISNGLDGLRRDIDPGPIDAVPYEATHRPLLPANLFEAVDALDNGRFYREAYGDQFVDWLVGMKRCELGRFAAAEPNWAEQPDAVTDWEHREYFTRY